MTTFVLIHGAYQGGWIWQPVAARLRAAGHIVYAPTLDGCAERRHQVRAGITTETHATEVAEMLFYEDLRDVVLVGTSTGGMVMCKSAELARERIARLVFVDALALLDSESLPDVVKRRNVVSTAVTTGPSPEDAETRLFADLDAPTRAWAFARYTLHPIAPMEAPVELASFWSEAWCTTVIWCRGSPNPPEAHQRRTAERLNGQWIELDAGHYPMLTRPDELARLLVAG